ncbi:ROK family protein [Sutcliffiella halmapala]|uniref:ROK family protein n=1 Tax=Sutcliffiella halmapala TaxID=79882 RepID=UPI0009958493|nr:ROK family protein [Sutcliffiella halmapala]
MTIRQDLAIGLDLGGTKILAALISRDGETVSEIENETSKQSKEEVTNSIFHTINRLLENAKVDRKRIKGIGIASAGIIDSKQKVIKFASNLGLENYPIGALLECHYELPVQLCNDANASAIAEWIWGAGKGKENLIYITVSTGVGAGIISNGSLVTGTSDSAGEFGHTSIMHQGIRCECGNRGCLEKYTSGTAIVNTAYQRLLTGEESSLQKWIFDGTTITNKHIAVAASEGDAFSINLLQEVGRILGTGVNNLIHLFNTEVIVFGGGVMNMSSFILPAIKETVRQYGIFHMVKDVAIEKTILGKRGGVMGASGLFFTNESTKEDATTNLKILSHEK